MIKQLYSKGHSLFRERRKLPLWGTEITNRRQFIQMMLMLIFKGQNTTSDVNIHHQKVKRLSKILSITPKFSKGSNIFQSLKLLKNYEVV